MEKELVLKFTTRGGEVVVLNLSNIERGIERIDKKAKAALQSAQRMTNRLGLVVAGMTAVFGGFAIAAVKAWGQLEAGSLKLESFVGNAEKAKTAYKALLDFAAETPFRLDDEILPGASALLQFDMAAVDTAEDIAKLTDNLNILLTAARGSNRDIYQVVNTLNRLRQGAWRSGELAPLLITAKKMEEYGVQMKKGGRGIAPGFEEKAYEAAMKIIEDKWRTFAERQDSLIVNRFRKIGDRLRVVLREAGEPLSEVVMPIVENLLTKITELRDRMRAIYADPIVREQFIDAWKPMADLVQGVIDKVDALVKLMTSDGERFAKVLNGWLKVLKVLGSIWAAGQILIWIGHLSLAFLAIGKIIIGIVAFTKKAILLSSVIVMRLMPALIALGPAGVMAFAAILVAVTLVVAKVVSLIIDINRIRRETTAAYNEASIMAGKHARHMKTVSDAIKDLRTGDSALYTELQKEYQAARAAKMGETGKATVSPDFGAYWWSQELGKRGLWKDPGILPGGTTVTPPPGADDLTTLPFPDGGGGGDAAKTAEQLLTEEFALRRLELERDILEKDKETLDAIRDRIRLKLAELKFAKDLVGNEQLMVKLQIDYLRLQKKRDDIKKERLEAELDAEIEWLEYEKGEQGRLAKKKLDALKEQWQADDAELQLRHQHALRMAELTDLDWNETKSLELQLQQVNEQITMLEGRKAAREKILIEGGATPWDILSDEDLENIKKQLEALGMVGEELAAMIAKIAAMAQIALEQKWADLGRALGQSIASGAIGTAIDSAFNVLQELLAQHFSKLAAQGSFGTGLGGKFLGGLVGGLAGGLLGFAATALVKVFKKGKKGGIEVEQMETWIMRAEDPNKLRALPTSYFYSGRGMTDYRFATQAAGYDDEVLGQQAEARLVGSIQRQKRRGRNWL